MRPTSICLLYGLATAFHVNGAPSSLLQCDPAALEGPSILVDDRHSFWDKSRFEVLPDLSFTNAPILSIYEELISEYRDAYPEGLYSSSLYVIQNIDTSQTVTISISVKTLGMAFRELSTHANTTVMSLEKLREQLNYFSFVGFGSRTLRVENACARRIFAGLHNKSFDLHAWLSRKGLNVGSSIVTARESLHGTTCFTFNGRLTEQEIALGIVALEKDRVFACAAGESAFGSSLNASGVLTTWLPTLDHQIDEMWFDGEGSGGVFKKLEAVYRLVRNTEVSTAFVEIADPHERQMKIVCRIPSMSFAEAVTIGCFATQKKLWMIDSTLMSVPHYWYTSDNYEFACFRIDARLKQAIFGHTDPSVEVFRRWAERGGVRRSSRVATAWHPDGRIYVLSTTEEIRKLRALLVLPVEF